jgi:hypothetical protein
MTRAEPSSVADFEPLRRAERLLLKACTRGDIARVGLRRPKEASPDVTVRAAFLALLARGGDDANPVRGRRIQLLGAWIDGRLDLGGEVVPLSLWFYRCVFDTVPLFDAAQVQGGLAFPDCDLPGLMAEGCSVALDLALNAGCTVSGEVRLRRARIGADLLCSRLKLQGHDSATSRRPLMADSVRIDGDVFLNDGLEAFGELRFVGAQIGGDFHAGHARITGSLDSGGARQAALVLDRAHVGGSVVLDAGFAAAGRVCLRRARIDGDLDCTAAAFDMLGDATWGRGVALVLDQAVVGGSLILRELQGPLLGASLAGTRVGALVDDATTWGERLVLDGFDYARLGDGAPVDAEFRLAWLGRQEPGHVHRADFRMQPWRRVISVLHQMGHSHSASQIAVRRESVLRRIGRVGLGMPVALRWLPRAGHAAFGALAGYGLRPQRLLGWALAAWLACTAAFWFAAEEGVFAPTDAQVFSDPRAASCRTPRPHWTRCPALPAEQPRFDALGYSLDQLVPLVDLQQVRHWAPMGGRLGEGVQVGDGVRWLGWLEALFGWVVLLLGLVSMSGWADRDRRN